MNGAIEPRDAVGAKHAPAASAVSEPLLVLIPAVPDRTRDRVPNRVVVVAAILPIALVVIALFSRPAVPVATGSEPGPTSNLDGVPVPPGCWRDGVCTDEELGLTGSATGPRSRRDAGW